MMKLLLIDQDIDYLTMLVRAIRESSYEDKMSVSIATEPNEWLAAERIAQYDVVVLGEQSFQNIPDMEGIAHIHWMVWSDMDSKMDDQEVTRIHKYQPVGLLLSEILAAYRRTGSASAERNAAIANCRIVALYSSSGGSGVSTIAQGLAELLALSGYRVCYVNMERIPGIQPLIANSDSIRFSRLLYHLRNEDQDKISKLWYKDTNRGYLTFPIPDYYGEWGEYSGTEIQSLLKAIARTDEVDMLVLDLEHALTEQTIAAIEGCHDLIWLEGQDQIARWKTEFVKRELVERMGEHLSKVSRMVKCPPLDNPLTHSCYLPYMNLLGIGVKEDLE